MKEIYKLSINNSDYWKYVSKNGFDYYEKTNNPCHLYLEKTNSFITDNMICNYKNASGINYLWNYGILGTRLREHKDFIVIEPSGIMIPKCDFKLVKNSDEIKENKSIDISDITRSTYFCNLISDCTRGIKNLIDFDEVGEYRNLLLKQNNKEFNPSFITPFEFAYMFVKICHKNGITSFDYYKLITQIVETYENKIDYFPLLYNIDISVGEHENESESLFNAFALLRYIGLIHPDYDSKYEYDDLVIDDNIDIYPSLIIGKEEYLPLMDKLVHEHFGLSNNKIKLLKNNFFNKRVVK